MGATVSSGEHDEPFMDINTMLEERLLQCCVHVGTAGDAGHQCAPFCAVQAWPALGRTKLSERAGRESIPLEAGATLGDTVTR